MSESVYKDLQRDARRLARMIDALAKPKFSSPEFVEQLQSALQKLPPASALGAAVEELRRSGDNLLKGEQRRRTEEFRRVEAAYIGAARKAGRIVREFDLGWRVGPLELEVDRAQARARVSFNHEQISPWKPVSSPEHFEALEQKAMGLLEKSALPEKELVTAMHAAYGAAASSTKRAPSGPEFLRQLRLELLRTELGSGNAGKKLKFGEFPLWALLYNIDRYRALGSKVDASQRLGFQTGSQQEQAKGLGIVLNGLDAQQDHRVYCHVIRAQ